MDYILGLLNLAPHTWANTAAIPDLRRETDESSDAVEHLSVELRTLRGEERHEREKLVLRLENALLKFERQLPPVKEPRKLKG
jgi:hypothetical protein